MYALTVVGCGGGGGDESVSAPVKALCDKFQSCGMVDSSMMGMCHDYVAVMAMYVVEPEEVAACLSGGTCEQINDQAFIEACLAYDTDSFECTDSDTLHICNTSGACKDIDCSQACEQIGYSSIGCTFDSTDQYYKCACLG